MFSITAPDVEEIKRLLYCRCFSSLPSIKLKALSPPKEEIRRLFS